MENKYYTPELKELYIGFQCEMEVYLTKEFEPVEMTRSLIYDSYHLLDNNRLRVKYLDASDIESCGFKEMERTVESVVYNMGAYGEYVLAVIRGYNEIMIMRNGFNLFRGKIKNLSELKQVLEMIGVEYDR